MSSIQPTFSSKSSPNFNEFQWVIQIQNTLKEPDSENRVSIFNVPKTLLDSDPDSYIPQQVAFGPYHYFRPELYEMEMYKVGAAKRTQKQLQSLDFETLVDQFETFESRIRGSYHKFLDVKDKTLRWMMAIDASFLLEFLQVYGTTEGEAFSVAYSGRKYAHDNAILRDMIMLENQIPLFVLTKMLEFQFQSKECSAEKLLRPMLMGLCKELSPFNVTDQDLPKIQVSVCHHLLDFLYQVITPRLELRLSEIGEAENQDEDTQHNKGNSSKYTKYVAQFIKEVWKLLSKVNKGPMRLITAPVKVIVKLPWTVISNLPGFSILEQPVEYLSTGNEHSSSAPLADEISIPSVSALSKAGVRFVPTNGSISTISFDAKACTFYLPATSLDVNTKVIMRNLVAYEVSNVSGPLVFTRYTELMNGIIDTEEDAKLLREKGIVVNRLKSDEEVTKLWNGMSKSIRLTRVPFLDKAIEDVNKYYNGKWKVKMKKFVKAYVFGSWQVLALLATLLLLLLMALQAFCSVYTCSRWFGISTTTST